VTTRRDQNHATGRTVAIVGGGALLAWLLLRGRGWGFGTSGSGGTESLQPAPSTRDAPLPACRVHVAADGIVLDGTRADLPATVSRCRASGAADVTVSGAAIVRAIAEVVQALQDAGVTVRADPAVWSTVRATAARRS
jgi:hypothetical protein